MINMDNQARKELLQSFCSTNENSTMSRPFLCGEFVCATDGHAILMLPATDEDRAEYSADEKKSIVIVGYINSEKEFQMYLETECLKCEYRKLKERVDKIDNRCDDCKGTGRVEFEYWSVHSDRYAHEDECPVCNGSGTKDISSKISEKKNCMPLTDRYSFNIYRLDELIRVLGFFGKEQCILQKQKYDVFPFHVIEPEFHLIIMPTAHS